MRHDTLNSAAILHIRSKQKAWACSSGTVRTLPSSYKKEQQMAVIRCISGVESVLQWSLLPKVIRSRKRVQILHFFSVCHKCGLLVYGALQVHRETAFSDSTHKAVMCTSRWVLDVPAQCCLTECVSEFTCRQANHYGHRPLWDMNPLWQLCGTGGSRRGPGSEAERSLRHLRRACLRPMRSSRTRRRSSWRYTT